MNAAMFGTQRQRLQCLDVLLAGRPRLVLIHRRDDVFARDRLDPAEKIAGIHAADMDGRQRARPEHHRRHAVPQ